jgi:hypothetical protein
MRRTTLRDETLSRGLLLGSAPACAIIVDDTLLTDDRERVLTRASALWDWMMQR